ncbi:MAG: hypothetical protein GXO26_08850, partial [Crenarchaeota archaeon]|nr:hypothetical protein [Thermoproteota archaeon]
MYRRSFTRSQYITTEKAVAWESDMGRVVWSKVAKVLREEYVEGNKCKICGEEIEEGENAFKTLSNIYKHFKEKHP